MERGISSVLLCLAVVFLVFPSVLTVKTSKGTQTEPSPPWINWANLTVVDLLRSGALIAIFAVVVVGDKNAGNRRPSNWTTVEMAGMFAAGLACFFFPTPLIKYQMDAAVNTLHIARLQASGVLLIAMAVSTWHLHTSLERDNLVHSSWLLARILGSSTLLAVMLHAQFRLGRMNDQHLSFAVLGVALWLIGSLVNLFSGRVRPSSRNTGSSTNSCLNQHLMFDLVYCTPLSFTLLAYPEWLCDMLAVKADFLDVYLLQVFGCLLLITCLQTMLALYYDSDDDKRGILAGRLTHVVLVLCLMTVYQWQHGVVTQKQFLLNLAIHVVPLINAFCSCYGFFRNCHCFNF